MNNAATTVAGTIAPVSAADSLTKAGPGQLLFTTSNTYAGPTFVNAGTLTLSGAEPPTPPQRPPPPSRSIRAAALTLDNTAANLSNRLSNNVSLNLDGGSFTLLGNGSAGNSTSESIASVNLIGGQSVITTPRRPAAALRSSFTMPAA